MADEATVWMVHARTGLNGLKGTLSLGRGKLLFHPETTRTGDTVVALADVKRVRRAWGTPVLEVYTDSDRHPPVVAFYFVQPPDLSRRHDSVNPVRRFAARREALRKLRLGNSMKKAEVDGWARAIEEARKG